MKKLVALFLSPFALLYGMGLSVHQSLYHSGFFKSVKFSIPVINIGNLAIGGTGKSPHIEYIIRLLKEYVDVSVISRGYRRKTSGYLLVDNHHSAADVGDEPLQMKKKFDDVVFAVSESRSLGIPKLLSQHPQLQVVLMDDGFQHLEVRAGLNILLTEYNNPYFNDYLLPSGRLREWKHGARRAQIIIVTKCPHQPNEIEIAEWKKKLQLQAEQQLFFSTIEYSIPYSIFISSEKFNLNPSMHITLVSAVAQSAYLSDYVAERVASVTDLQYADHHFFTDGEIKDIIERHQSNRNYNKIILTTEKDATRLLMHRDKFQAANLSIYAIPIEVKFYEKELFDQSIKKFLLDFKV